MTASEMFGVPVEGMPSDVRRRAKEELDRIVRDGEAGEDEVARAEKELESLTKKHVDAIDVLLAGKENELLEV